MASDRRSTPCRNYVRRPAPLGSGALQGQLINSDGASCSIKIWDLGEGGVCVFTQSAVEILMGDDLILTIFDRYERLDHNIKVRLAWRTQEGITFFLGLAFEQPIESGLFYERYLATGQR